MEDILKQLLTGQEKINNKLDKMEVLFEDNNKRLDKLEALVPLVEESHRWLLTLVENKEFQKAEMDNLQHKVVNIEGALTGVAESLEPFKKAQ